MILIGIIILIIGYNGGGMLQAALGTGFLFNLHNLIYKDKKKMEIVKKWNEFLNESVNKFESFEYIDRDYDSKIVQVGMFEKITNKDQIKKGDRFLCPRTTENQRCIIDSNTMKPILLYKSCEMQSEWHISYQYHKDKVGKSGQAVAWDICYLLRDDI